MAADRVQDDWQRHPSRGQEPRGAGLRLPPDDDPSCELHQAVDDLLDVLWGRTIFKETIGAPTWLGLGFIVLGAVYNMQSRFDDSIRVLDRGLMLMPRSWQGMFELGKAELGKGNYEAALRRLNKASDLSPEQYAPIHLAKAHALLGMKNFSEASSELEAYLEQDPKSPNAAAVRESLDQVRAFVASSK